MYKAVIEQLLEGEMEEHLGYPPDDRQLEKAGNYRNGKKKKQVKSKLENPAKEPLSAGIGGSLAGFST